MDIEKTMKELRNKTTKFKFTVPDADIIYAASNLDMVEVSVKYFGKDRFTNLLKRIENAITTPEEDGETVEMLVLVVITIMLNCAIDPLMKEQIIQQVGKETLNEAFKLIKDALEPYMKGDKKW